MNWDSIGKFVVDAGLTTTVVAVIGLVVDAIRKNKALKLAKAKADSLLSIAKDKADDERVITREMGAKVHNESDEVIVRAADAIVGTMQRRVNAVENRLVLTESEAKLKRDEIDKLYARIGVLELALIQKTAEIAKRDTRISELECQIASQEAEINHLKAQVCALELAAEKKA